MRGISTDASRKEYLLGHWERIDKPGSVHDKLKAKGPGGSSNFY